MANLLYDIAQYLIQQGHATQDGVDIFRDYRPDSPDNVIVLSEYNNSHITYTKSGNRYIQILVRNNQAEQARLNINSIYNDLCLNDEPVNETLPNNRFGVITSLTGPMQIGRDEKNRSIYVFNISIITTFD